MLCLQTLNEPVTSVAAGLRHALASTGITCDYIK